MSAEVAGYRDALGLIHESGDQMPFSEGTVLQLHGMLYRYMPQPGGHWKAANNDIIERHPDRSSRVRFRPVAAHLTPMAMADMISRYRTALDQHLADPLVLVPLAILDFLCIHPFPDGNGRMARLLTLQLLYHFDYAVGRFISLERIFEESKESYYETLEASSQGWHEAAHTSPHGSTISGVLCCAPTRNSKSAWAPSSAVGAPRVIVSAQRFSSARCPFPSRRLRKPALASAATWCA